MRAAGWLAALAAMAAACTARAAILYWTIDGTAGESFTSAYLQTLECADGNTDNVVAWLYSLDASTGERIDYEPAVGLESVDSGGTMFCGESNPTEIPSDPGRIYGVGLGVLEQDGSVTAYFSSERHTFESLVEMAVVQISEVGVYDHAWNLAMASWSVPEPNGALLMLLGVAVLSLRRKRNA
ncbi:MAG: PEP-CTERM sorting domain-containing protein [Kiritimatiellia bacterium]